MKKLSCVALCIMLTLVSLAFDHILTVRIDPVYQIPKTLFGIFFEDINHAVDGGIYAELIKNRSFEHTFSFDGWSFKFDEKLSSVSLDNAQSLNTNNKNYLKIQIKTSNTEVALINTGYNGVPLLIGETYILSFYVRTINFSGKIAISLESKKGEKFAEGFVTIERQISDWTKISLELVSKATVTNAQFVMKISGEGEVYLDMISLILKDTWHGMRKDLVAALRELNPGFLRFPGGCLVEGDSLQNAYRWKDTVGPIEERKTKRNLWGYHQSYGLGFYEFLVLAEYLGAEPIPIFNAGISCQVRGAQFASMENLDEWIQDVLEFLEFANGPTDSHWGSLRANLGHPEPFNVKYIGIGNENWGDEYHQRFTVFQTAIKSKYPQTYIVFSGPPSYEGSNFRHAVRWARENNIDIFDEHIYAPPEWFLANTSRYDKYDRTGPKIMLGEYAAHTPGRQNSWHAGLAEAAFLTGVIRNSDVVLMTSYAPLLNRVGLSQWIPDLIWFDSTRVFLTPSYFVQKLYSEVVGNYLIPSEMTDEELDLIGYKFKSLYHVSTYNAQSKCVVIFIVNPWPEDRNVEVRLPGDTKFKEGFEVVRILGSPTDANDFDNCSVIPIYEQIMTNSQVLNFVAKGYSFNVLRIGVE